MVCTQLCNLSVSVLSTMLYTWKTGILISVTFLNAVTSAFEFVTLNNIVLRTLVDVEVKSKPLTSGPLNWTYVRNDKTRIHIGTSVWSPGSGNAVMSKRTLYYRDDPLLLGYYLRIDVSDGKRNITSNFTVFMNTPWGISMNTTPTVGRALEMTCLMPEQSTDITGMEWKWREEDKRKEGYVILGDKCNPNEVIKNWGYHVRCDVGQMTTNVSLTIPASKMDSSLNGSLWRCVEFNKRVGSRFLKFDLQEFPKVSISNISARVADSNVTLVCQAKGHPSDYKYRWEQRINSHLIQSHQDLRGYLTTGGSKLTIPSLTYQDAGEYICNVSNGVSNQDNVLWATAVGNLSVIGSPILPPLNPIFYAEDDVNFTIQIPFYSNPTVKTSEITLKNTDTFEPLRDSSELCITVEESEVEIPFYGQFIALMGQKALIQFYNMSKDYHGRYLVIITNTVKRKTQFSFEIKEKQRREEFVSTSDSEPFQYNYVIYGGVAISSLVVLSIITAVCLRRRSNPVIVAENGMASLVNREPDIEMRNFDQEDDGYEVPRIEQEGAALVAAGQRNLSKCEMSLAENSHLWEGPSEFHSSTTKESNPYETIRVKECEALYEQPHETTNRLINS